jgi:hypothetical protein
MRTYVCAQCHVEYYFLGENKVLTFPWSQGLNIDDIEAHYDAYGFADWTHAETGAPMIKIQHPEYEMWSTGCTPTSGVACADCHMPYMRDGAVKVSDHWLRSPLTNLEQRLPDLPPAGRRALRARGSLTIQNRPPRCCAPLKRRCWMPSTPSSPPRRRARPTRTVGRGAATCTAGVAALGLRLVGEQHRLPQPAGVGPRAGDGARLCAPGAAGGGARRALALGAGTRQQNLTGPALCVSTRLPARSR